MNLSDASSYIAAMSFSFALRTMDKLTLLRVRNSYGLSSETVVRQSPSLAYSIYCIRSVKLTETCPPYFTSSSILLAKLDKYGEIIDSLIIQVSSVSSSAAATATAAASTIVIIISSVFKDD